MHPGGPPPPPPPPLPPPPPPLFSPHHGPGLPGRGNRRRSRMRNFNWETLPKHSVVGKHNIWTVDKHDGGYELDTDHMEELFSHNQGHQQQNKVLNRLSIRGLPAFAPAGERVSILNPKRSMNIGIFLKQFKRPVKDMIEDIKLGRCQSFGSGKLRELCRLLPDEGEVKELLGFKGDPYALPEADLFMLHLIKIPSYEERLSCFVLKEEFFPFIDEMMEFIDTMTKAGAELLECENLHSIIRLVLKTGNYMNAGGYAGSAIGFRMASLLKLADTKANKPGMNLMHYVVMQAQRADMKLLKFPEELKHIESAAKIKKSEVESEFERQLKKVQNAKADCVKQEDLKAQMEDFLKEADGCIEEVETRLQELKSVSDSVAEYFCEDSSKFKLEECCSIFYAFCEKFKRAMKENKAREMAEVKQRHIARLDNTAKRRSTATCSIRDKEMNGIALEHILQNFITNRGSRRKPGRPSSSQGSPINGSPTNQTLAEIISQKNLSIEKQRCEDEHASRNEWNLSTELTDNFLIKKTHSAQEDRKGKQDISHEENAKTNTKEDSVFPTKSNSNISKDRPFSTSAADDEEDVQDNNEVEAQKLREASKKVLHYQNSRSSITSGEFCLENQKSPAPNTRLRRQLTFDEETQRYPGDPTNEDLVRFLLNDESSNRNLGRRHTLPTKIHKPMEEKKENLQDQPAVNDKRPKSKEGTGNTPSELIFDFTNRSHDIKSLDSKDVRCKKIQPNEPHLSNISFLEQNKEETKPTDLPPRRNSENLHRNSWFKTDTSGLFFNFFKRLGDLSKPQSSREIKDSSV